MKYTYEISFNGSDYSTLVPGTSIQMSGEWIEGTKIWRENISELLITKRENSTVYGTLESWFTDDTKFETKIFVKILKSGVQDSLHWFGVKWGTINKETKTFTVQPIAHDYWGQYFESTKDIKNNTLVQTVNYQYFDTTPPYSHLGRVNNAIELEEAVKQFATNKSGWSTSDVVSTFLWQDTYESGASVGTVNQVPKDYVTDEASSLNRAGLVALRGKSFSDLLEYLLTLRTYCFFDSNDKLRFEHISFFIDKLEDNAVDFSSLIRSDDDEWGYEIESLPTSETIILSNDEIDDDDFGSNNITYSGTRNRPDAQSSEFRSSLRTYLGTSAVNLSEDLYLVSATKNTSYEFFNNNLFRFVSDGNGLDLRSISVGQNCGSNDFTLSTSLSYSLTVSAGTLTGSWDMYLETRTGSLKSNKITVNSTGLQGFTLTPLAGVANDIFLKIEARTASSTFVGAIVLDAGATSTIQNVDGFIGGTTRINGALSVGNIIDKWWKHDRLSRSGTFNGSDYDFEATKYNLRRKDIRIYYSGVINPLHGFDDGNRIGMIDKWERDLDTDFYTISLLYQEDE